MKRKIYLLAVIIGLLTAYGVSQKMSSQKVVSDLATTTATQDITNLNVQGYPIWESENTEQGYKLLLTLVSQKVGIEFYGGLGQTKHLGYLDIGRPVAGVVANYSGFVQNKEKKEIFTIVRIEEKKCFLKDKQQNSPYTVNIDIDGKKYSGCIQEAKAK